MPVKRQYNNRKHPSTVAWPALIALIGLLGLFAWQYGLLLDTSEGLFSYVLDDAYIHLALSENLMQGHYGVNLTDYSAPSSSILWSFILAPLATWAYWPLVLNIALSVIALLLWNTHLQRILPESHFNILRLVLNISFIFIANLVGMSFTGMENVLQLVVAMGILLGILQLIQHKTLSYWLLLCIIVAPLVRYETISLSCIALLFIALNGYFRQAVVCAVLMMLPLIGFSFFLNSLDLGFMPSSVSAKSSAMQASALVATLGNFYLNLYETTGSLLLALCIPLVWAGASQWRTRPQVTLLTVMITAAVIAHLALGRIGNWGRYEIYVWISLLMTCLFIFQRQLKNWYTTPSFPRWLGYAALVVFIVIFGKRYLVTSTMNHVGGANITLQQYQMHRFVTEFWQNDVAVNDLGWVAYQNDHYVLDLWGLANKQALELRKAGAPDFLHQLTESHSIGLAMIYKQWFETQIPADWQLIGELHLPEGMRLMTPAHENVAFYATQPQAAEEIHDKLQAFAKTLPAGAFVRFSDDWN